jgi:hypothetical protein
MSNRRFEISGTQVVASVLATVTGAVAASFLGVAGTIIGAAVMSVAGTAGSAVYNHYLGRTARRLRSAGPAMRQRAGEDVTTAGAHGTAQPGTRPVEQRAQPVVSSAVTVADAWDPGSLHPGSPDPGFPHPGSLHPGSPHPGDAGTPSGWLRRRPRWLLGAVASAGIFVGVIAGITVFELAAGKPLAAVVWHRSGSGTSVGGGNVAPDPAASPRHASPATRRATPSAGPTSPSPSGTGTSPVSSSPSPTPSPGSSPPSPSPSPTVSQSTTLVPARTP